jgi:hypothetical protein
VNTRRSCRLAGADLNDVTVACGCGRQMTLDVMRGRGAYRCGCGVRAKLKEPEYSKTQCVGLEGGRRCRRTADIEGPVPLCRPCLHELRAVTGLIKPEEVEEYTDLLAAARDFQINLGELSKETCLERVARARAAEDKRIAAKYVPLSQADIETRLGIESVVYFVRMGDLIKIGTTTNLHSRISSLSLTMSHVLATERGSYSREGDLHRRFASLREHGEWFRAEPELLDYIKSLKPLAGRKTKT